MAEAILALSATTNGRLAVEGFRELERRTGTRLADLAEGSEEKRIAFADTQARPVPVITSPEWSGSETGGRRYAPFTVNVERDKPWHTLTGRMHFLLDHDWMHEMGETLPTFRVPLDMSRLFAEPTIGDADVISVRDNDWVEAHNRNGVMVLRAIVSHRMPAGTVFVYHAQERVVNVPKTERSGRRGGIHNSLTRIMVKPTHLIGGYAQLSFAFNYLGPTGNQRDEVTVIRRRASQNVEY